MNKEETEQPEPPYWTLDTSLFDGRFKYFSRELEPVQVRGKVHLAQERYNKSDVDLEIVPLKTRSGTCTYFHMKPFVLVPDMLLTVGLYPTPKQYADQDEAIGELIKAREQKPKEVEIGQAQAWYYPQDRVIAVWECYLLDFVRDTLLLEDPNTRDLWDSFARFLRKQCVGAERIAVTAYDDDLGEREEYQQFLSTLGYAPHPGAKAAWSKPIELA